MSGFKECMENLIYSKIKYNTDLSKETGVSESAISKWLTGDSEISAFSFTKIICTLIPDDKALQENLTIQYLKSLKEGSSLNPKILFVLSYLNRNMNVFAYLMKMCKSHKYSSVRKYTQVFELYQLRLEGENVKDLYGKIDLFRKNINDNEKDIDVLCDILSMIILLDLGEMELVEMYYHKINQHFLQMNKNVLKVIYKLWAVELFSYYLLRKNEVNKFNRYFNVLRRQPYFKYFPVLRATLDLKIGESKLFDNKYKEISLLFEESLCIFEKWGNESRYRHALNNLHFLRINEWKDIDKLNFEYLHPAELSFYYIQLEEYDKANLVLDRLEKEQGYLSALQVCYRGMAHFDIELIRKSIEMFRKNNDYFFVKFAEEMLDKFTQKSKIVI